MRRLLIAICVSASCLQCFASDPASSKSISNLTNIIKEERNSSTTEQEILEFGNSTSTYVQSDFLMSVAEWSTTSQCSRTCGGGVVQIKSCQEGRTDYDQPCIGPTSKYISCNVQACPPGSKDFRTVQCERKNAKFNVPYYSPRRPCSLMCRSLELSKIISYHSNVTDGTKCSDDGSSDICIDGKCMPAGCDNILGSPKKADHCGVCEGDGSSCETVRGVIYAKDLKEDLYQDILLIPAGATSILVKNSRNSRNSPPSHLFAVRGLEEEMYCWALIGEYAPYERMCAGTLFVYTKTYIHGSGVNETLEARGPTTEKLYIMLTCFSRNCNSTDISYEYTVHTTQNPFFWAAGEFGECSRTCGEGTQSRLVNCVRSGDLSIVNESLCDPSAKPNAYSICNLQLCPLKWQTGEWDPCVYGFHYRKVYCPRDERFPFRKCEVEKPDSFRPCNTDEKCDPYWITGEWSECDSRCGSGKRTRTVECRFPPGFGTLDCPIPVVDSTGKTSGCDPETKPEVERNCSSGPCEDVEWKVTEWSGCTKLCSDDYEMRRVYCADQKGTVFPNDACIGRKWPGMIRSCQICIPMWYASEWSECSVQCGNGIQSRDVFCGVWKNYSFSLASSEELLFRKACGDPTKPESVRNCSAEDFCPGEWFTSPWSKCSAPCDKGERNRTVVCLEADKVVDDSRCNPNRKPFYKELCSTDPCDKDTNTADLIRLPTFNLGETNESSDKDTQSSEQSS